MKLESAHSRKVIYLRGYVCDVTQTRYSHSHPLYIAFTIFRHNARRTCDRLISSHVYARTYVRSTL